MCAGVCKDTQHGSYFAMPTRGVKRFMLLRNINFIVGNMRITKPKRLMPLRSCSVSRNVPVAHAVATRWALACAPFAPER